VEPVGTGHAAGGGVDGALARAALYEVLSLGFGTPTAETIERLSQADTARALIEAAGVVDSAPEACGALRPHVVALVQQRVQGDALAAEHRRLFGHTARGAVPPYETEYGDDDLFQQPQELADLAGFVRAFGLTLHADAHERIDHVSCQCEFMFFLACKEAYALTRGDAETAAVTRDTARAFLRDHLARFAPAFARRLREADPAGFFGSLAGLLLALVSEDCARFGVGVGEESLRLRLPAVGCVPMGCGSGADCGLPGAGADVPEE
jgi:DMSO reductase family type II enzyme chaperone